MTLPSKLPHLSACLLGVALVGTNGASAQTINALGTGIASAYVSGCTPQQGKDFIDAVNWDHRMVEPRDCTLVRIATPIFSWPLPADLMQNSAMTLTIVRPDGSSISRVGTSPRLILTGARLLPGQYRWSVSYTDKTGVPVQSQMRRFSVDSKAGLLNLPNGAGFASTVAAKPHPRALPKGANFASIAVKAQNGEYRQAYARFLKKAADLLPAQPVYVPSPPTAKRGEPQYSAYMTQVRDAAVLARSTVETLGYAGHFTGNTAYLAAARKHLLALAAWNATGMSGEENQDQANREVYLGLSIGLDLLQGQLSPADRAAVVAPLKTRLSQVLAKFPTLDRIPNDSHMIGATGYATEALMYAVGTPEFPEAQAWLATSWNAYIPLMSGWSGSTDGAFANSTAYGWYTMVTRSRMLAAIRLIADLDLTPMPVAGNYGDNQIALSTPNAILRAPFGDELEIDRHYVDYAHDAYRLYASVTGKPEHEWYWRVRPANLTLSTPLQAMHYLMLGVRIPVAPEATPAMPNSWLFEDAGMVALHSRTSDPARSSVFFRSSRFGSANHSHADNNAFTFVSHGKAMFISGGYDTYFDMPHHALVNRATRYKNALTFDGGIGQSEPVSVLTASSRPGKPRYSMETRGQLINFADTGAWAVTTGDATLAYRGMAPTETTYTPFLSNAIRSVGFNREKGVVVVYDYATSDSARKWELNFQSLQPGVLSGRTLLVTNEGVSSCLDIYGQPGAFSFTSGFAADPRADNPYKTYAQQYQSRYSAASPSKQLVAVTVIREDCKAVVVNVAFNGTIATVSIAGATPLTFDRKTIRGQ